MGQSNAMILSYMWVSTHCTRTPPAKLAGQLAVRSTRAQHPCAVLRVHLAVAPAVRDRDQAGFQVLHIALAAVAQHLIQLMA